MSTVRPARPLWVGIVVVVAFFASVTLTFAWLDNVGPLIPHVVDDDRVACTTCHPAGRLPESHQGRVDASCASCHATPDPEAGDRVGFSAPASHGAAGPASAGRVV